MTTEPLHDEDAALDSLPPVSPPLARRHHPDLQRLARTYRVGAWTSLVVGPLIGAMSLSASLEGVGRALWIVFVVVATAFTFITWRATSELILALVDISDGVSRTEYRTRRLESQMAENPDRKRVSGKRAVSKRLRSKSPRAPRQTKQDETEEDANLPSPFDSSTHRTSRTDHAA